MYLIAYERDTHVCDVSVTCVGGACVSHVLFVLCATLVKRGGGITCAAHVCVYVCVFVCIRL